MRILFVEDDGILRSQLKEYLENELGHQVTDFPDGERAYGCFRNERFPLVLSDICLPGMDGIELLRRINGSEQAMFTDVVLITGHGEIENAIEALRAGAYDYLLKPFTEEELGAVVERVSEHQRLVQENFELTHHFDRKVVEATRETETRLKKIQSAYARIVGAGEFGVFSDSMQSVVALAEKLHADRTVPVLIEGETGTGKELAARLVHYGRGEVDAPFVSVNCSAITPGLFESELFGYEGGAYTGASKEGRIGKLELAAGGTLFLDEIGDLPPDIQPKLLRVLEEREFYRVGGLKKIPVDVRIICATNRDLQRMVEAGTFRRDLYYRLNLGRIYLPPLRERREAIAPLAEMFLRRYARRKKSRFSRIHPEALRLLRSHDWPGNVRELENALERLVLLYDDEQVRPEHLSFLGSGNREVPLVDGTPIRPGRLVLPREGLNLKALEAEVVRKALAMFNGNKTRAAEYLGISRGALHYKLSK